jgi:hypothetical protein
MTTTGATQELEVTLKLRVKIEAATVRFDGEPWTVDSLVSAIQDAIFEEMPYSEEDREPTDLVQQVLEVEAEVLT